MNEPKDFSFPSWMGPNPRVSSPWSTAEEDELVRAYKAGESLKKLSEKHGRLAGGIESRLMRILGENFYTSTPKPCPYMIGQRVIWRNRIYTVINPDNVPTHHANSASDVWLQLCNERMAVRVVVINTKPLPNGQL